MVEYNKVNAVATSLIWFSTFLGVLIALVLYLQQIFDIGLFFLFIIGIIYIDIHLTFLYYLKRKGFYEKE